MADSFCPTSAWNWKLGKSCRQQQKLLPARLHMLQMVCKKLANACLCSDGSDPDTLQSSHAYVAKNLPVIARQIVANRTGGQTCRHDQTMTEIKLLAKEIELLHPDHKANGQRPDNCEYPWKDASALVHAPANHQF